MRLFLFVGLHYPPPPPRSEKLGFKKERKKDFAEHYCEFVCFWCYRTSHVDLTLKHHSALVNYIKNVIPTNKKNPRLIGSTRIIWKKQTLVRQQTDGKQKWIHITTAGTTIRYLLIVVSLNWRHLLISSIDQLTLALTDHCGQLCLGTNYPPD